jgi:ADP-heptose:LPS heptosyltransferase
MKIAIGRIGHIGDIIACEPVSRYLRHKYPEAHLSWVVEAAYRELIDTNPHIDETVVVECTTDWIKLAKHGAYDEIVDLHPNFRACKHCRTPLIKTSGNPRVSIYEYLNYGTLLEAFSIGAGLPKLSAAPQVYLQPTHAAAVDALGLPAEYCVIHRQSTSPEKDWSASDWRTVADWIARELRIPIVEIGATGHAAPSPLADVATDLVNRTSILETAEVIRRARFFVGVDSAPAHLANAVRAPGVVLLGRLGVFRSYMPFNGYYAGDATEVTLVRNLAGPVRDIAVTDVIAAIRRVADAVAPRGRAATARPARAASRPAPAAVVTEEHRRLVRASGLFDRSWYVVHHPEAAAPGVDALDHFLALGGALGFSPGPEFDVRWYVAQHGDVARSSLNPLLHFLERGRAEGRLSRPAAVAREDAGRDSAAAGLRPGVEREEEEGVFQVMQAAQMRTARIQRALDVTRAQLDAERRALAKLHASTSWRVTAPLRGATLGLRTAFRRLRGR